MKFKMDRKSTTARSELMCILCDEEAEPKALSLALLEEITDGFSEEREIGRGGFAVVYKGILDNGAVVAVKRLSNTYMYEKQFQWEVECLIKAKHKNVVRFIGYCADSQGKAESYNGKFVMAEIQQRLLCFEYLSHGTLDKYITDESSGLDWRTRYKIINGICNGLHYLHQNRIVHLDLKPQNILLDGNMLPKIADFGQSRCFEENQSRVVTKNIGGTIGYLAPEFSSREITYQLDLYSLGVIILEILTGKKGYEAVENVLENWRNRLEKSHRDMQLKQVRVSTEIGIKCIDSNPANRPARTQDIIASLHETANAEGTIETVMTRSLAPQDISFSGSSIFALDRTMTEQMSEMVLLAVVKIGYILEDETANAIVMNALSESVAKELSVKVKQIRKQLTMMGNVIKRTGMVYLRDQVVRSWIGEVRNVAYNVEDVMDKYSYHVLQHQQEGFLKKFFTKGTHHAVFSEITDHIVKVENEIQLVIQLKDQWLQPSQLIADPHIEMERHPSRRNLSECFDEHLVGIEENRSLLTGWLNSEEPESTVITVSGFGGLGKSTLVSNVYEREKINFDAHAWIVVSQMYTVHDLLRNLLWKIEYTEQPLSAGIEKMDVYDLRKEIKRRFQNIKCFIVLDDVWDRDVYFQMGDAFQNLQRSRIVITTRKNDVATISSPTRHLELLPLSNHDAFNLFCKRAFYKRKGQICPKELEEIAASIVDKCHGLPLAIVSIGSMLSRRQRLEIWRQTYNELCNELSDNDHVRAILNLSYHDLSGELRSCLLYCTLFPEDHPMSCDSLVRLWVAEGFVLSNDKNTAEVVAERDIVELIHRNMLEVVEKDASGRISTCRMHDLVRELALSVAHQQRFASANDYGTMIQMDKDVRRLSLCGWNGDTVPKLKLPRLRTLVMLGLLSSSTGVLSSILSESNYLTVLELQDSEITEVPASIGNLFNLRYIGLRRTRIKSIPESIENLSNLHTIDIKQTKVEKLPRGLANVKKLRHLLADRYADEKKQQTGFHCYFIGMQAPRNMSNLEQLQTLETVASDNGLAQQLRKLMQLRSVWIDNITASDCADILDTLSNLPLLSSLLLSARDENEALCFQALKPKSRNLERLIIRGQWANGTLNCPIFLSHGTNLKYLALSWCRLVDDPLEKLAPHIPNLTYLRLNNMRSANALVLSADAFPNLKTLVLKHMHDVSELIIIEGALPCIQGLYIAALSKLDKVPRGIESLHSLKKLWLLSLHEDFKTEWITNRMHQKIQHIPEIRV